MQVLHWDFSERYDAFMEWFRSVCKKRIFYRYIETHPNPAFHTRQGVTEVHPAGVQVYLNRTAARELAEENAAHELTHVALFEQGYAYATLRNPYQSEWQPIIRAIQSWISDVIIDRKLLNYGYTNADYYDLLYRSTKENLINFPNPSLNRMDQIGNALGYFYCANSLTTEQWEDLHQVYREIDPPVVELGDELIRMGEEMGFLGTTSYRRFLVAIRDHMDLSDVIVITDPLEKATY